MRPFLFSVGLSLAYLIALLALHFAHMRWLKVDVVFYAAIKDGVMAALLLWGAMHLCPAVRQSLSIHERLMLGVIWLLGGYAFAISVPTVIDRSLSFYVLEKIQQRGGAVKQEHIDEIFIREYVPEHRLMDIRLTEQIASGTIFIDKEGCIRLTAKGDRLARLSRAYRNHLLPKQRLLLGEYTDVLTDPFRYSQKSVDYICEKELKERRDVN